MNVLFLCTGNSARSILAEATFNHLAPAGWTAQSAGSRPQGAVHPLARALLERQGISVAGLHSKSWESLPVAPDIVITVCANAAAEICPAYLGPAVRAHWGLDDPACVEGMRAQQAFETAYRILRDRIERLLSLPLDALGKDPVRFKTELDRIGAQDAGKRLAAQNAP